MSSRSPDACKKGSQSVHPCPSISRNFQEESLLIIPGRKGAYISIAASNSLTYLHAGSKKLPHQSQQIPACSIPPCCMHVFTWITGWQPGWQETLLMIPGSNKLPYPSIFLNLLAHSIPSSRLCLHFPGSQATLNLQLNQK